MEEYLRTPTEPRGEAKNDAVKEAKRIADGWLTVQEIADKWNCSYMKALDILVTSHAEWKWEDGKPYQGRKLWKIPETLSRQPTVHKISARTSTKKDWLDSLPKIDGAQIKEMVLDERRGKKLVGKTVVVEMKGSGVVFTGKLEFYNMCQFFVRKNGVVNRYRHNEAKVLKEAINKRSKTSNEEERPHPNELTVVINERAPSQRGIKTAWAACCADVALSNRPATR